MLRALHLSQLPSRNGKRGHSRHSVSLPLAQPCSQRARGQPVPDGYGPSLGPWGHVGAAALAISRQEAWRRSACRAVNARVAQLAHLTGFVGFKAIVLARRKQAQVAAGCPERNALEAGVHNELGTVHVCALWGGNVWPAGALLRGMCVDPGGTVRGVQVFLFTWDCECFRPNRVSACLWLRRGRWAVMALGSLTGGGRRAVFVASWVR